MELFQEKKKIRKTVLAAREALSAPERERGDCLITERILGHQWFYRSDELLCFVSYGSEISTLEILREALGAGKKVYVPKVLGEKNGFLQNYLSGRTETGIPGDTGTPRGF